MARRNKGRQPTLFEGDVRKGEAAKRAFNREPKIERAFRKRRIQKWLEEKERTGLNVEDVLKVIMYLDDRDVEIRQDVRIFLKRHLGLGGSKRNLVGYLMGQLEEEHKEALDYEMDRLVYDGSTESKRILATVLPWSHYLLAYGNLLALLSLDDDEDVARRAKKGIKEVLGRIVRNDTIVEVAMTDFEAEYNLNLLRMEEEQLSSLSFEMPPEPDEEDTTAREEYYEELEGVEAEKGRARERTNSIEEITAKLEGTVYSIDNALNLIKFFVHRKGYEKNAKRLLSLLRRYSDDEGVEVLAREYL